MAREHERIAKAFHDEYEARAPQHGYETREASAVPWEQVPEANRNLMIGTVAALLRQGVIYPASVLEERDRTIEQLKHRPYIQSLEESIGIAHANEGLAEERAEKAEAEAESLRSQLTEARALLDSVEWNVLDGFDGESPILISRSSWHSLRMALGLVPAPQDREPTT